MLGDGGHIGTSFHVVDREPATNANRPLDCSSPCAAIDDDRSCIAKHFHR